MCLIAVMVTKSHPFWLLHMKLALIYGDIKSPFLSFAPEISLFQKKVDLIFGWEAQESNKTADKISSDYFFASLTFRA